MPNPNKLGALPQISPKGTLTPELLSDPRFKNLLAKAETHQRQFRPKETKMLESQGKLQSVLQQRTLACWEELKAARQAGMSLDQAQEIAFPAILLPDERDDSPRSQEK
jgi:hypothetical protein